MLGPQNCCPIQQIDLCMLIDFTIRFDPVLYAVSVVNVEFYLILAV